MYFIILLIELLYGSDNFNMHLYSICPDRITSNRFYHKTLILHQVKCIFNYVQYIWPINYFQVFLLNLFISAFILASWLEIKPKISFLFI